MVLNIAILLALAYVALCALIAANQRNLIYHVSPDAPLDHELRYARLAPWPAKDAPRGLISTEPSLAARGTILVFHGNAGRALDRDHYVAALAPLGFRVILMEYPGFGGRPGSPSETAFVTDAKESLKLAATQFPGPIYLFGESLGCGVVASIASDSPRVSGVALMTPWDSLPNVAQSTYPFLPAKWLVRDRFDSVENLKRFPERVAVLLADRDEIVPARHGERLFQSLPEANRKLWRFPDATHNTWPHEPDARWWTEVADFLAPKDGRDGRR